MSSAAATTAQKAPWHLWVVGVIALLWNAMGAVDYLMTKTKNEAWMSNFTPEQLEFYYSFPTWVVAAWATAVWGAVLGSVLLLLRKRLAMPVFIVSLVAFLLTGAHNFILTDGMRIMGGVGPAVFTAVIFTSIVALIAYSRAMTNNGVWIRNRGRGLASIPLRRSPENDSAKTCSAN